MSGTTSQTAVRLARKASERSEEIEQWMDRWYKKRRTNPSPRQIEQAYKRAGDFVDHKRATVAVGEIVYMQEEMRLQDEREEASNE